MADIADSPILWDPDGAPRSRLYDDVYFSRDGGLAEARAVFLEGCGLPDAWTGRERFCVAELGFGSGLNIVALLELWARTRGHTAHLTVFSLEAHPLAADEAARALSAWPEISQVAESLLARWPGRARGFHRLDLPELNATLDLAVMDAKEALAAWSGLADAWFLDGFTPARNPEMWRSEVIELVAARSAPGAKLATYTVAGAVRRDLARAGFSVTRAAGFGKKRERLEGRLPGAAPAGQAHPRIAIVGGGVAGASLARAFRALGVEATTFEAAALVAGASGGPAALVTPRLDAGLGPPAALFAQAFRRAVDLYGGQPDVIISRGAIQLEAGPKDGTRFAKIEASDLFEAGRVRRLEADAAGARLGETTPAGLTIKDAMVIEPAPLLAAWLGRTWDSEVAALAFGGGGWTLLGADGSSLCQADVVCLAAGMGSARLATGLPLMPVRGQAGHAAGAAVPIAAVFGAYVIPTRDGVLFGATHDRGDEDTAVRQSDHTRNLQALEQAFPRLAARLDRSALGAHTGIRATTRDYLPLAGEVPGSAGLFVLGGLGSRGFTLAPLLAEHVAATALGVPSPLPRALAQIVDPARFAARERRRGRP